MPDDVELNPGSGGDIIAADLVGSVKYTRCKITLGADGSADGDVSSSMPMPASILPSGTFVSYGQTAVGGTYVNLANHAAVRGVIIKALAGNTANIYVGNNNSVTTSGTTGGLELIPGDSIFLPLTNLNLVFCISTIAAQKVSWVVI